MNSDQKSVLIYGQRLRVLCSIVEPVQLKGRAMQPFMLSLFFFYF